MLLASSFRHGETDWELRQGRKGGDQVRIFFFPEREEEVWIEKAVSRLRFPGCISVGLKCQKSPRNVVCGPRLPGWFWPRSTGKGVQFLFFFPPVCHLLGGHAAESIFRLSEFRDNKNRHDYIDYISRGLQIEDPSKDAARALLNDPPLVVRIRPNVTFCLQSYHWFSQPNKLFADFIGTPAHPCSAINYSMSLAH